MDVPSVCYEAWRDLTITRGQRDKYRALVFAVSVGFTIAALVLIATVIWGESVTRSVAALAAIAAGGGLGFVIRERNRADENYASAYRTFSTTCGSAKGAAAVAGAGEGVSDDVIASLAP